MKKFGLVAILTIVLSSLPVFAAQGSQLFSDTFNDVSQVDTTKTTAIVDTGDGWVELWHPSQTNVIASQADANGLPQNIVVATTNGAEWYTVNDASGKMKLDAVNSYTATDVLGVSLVPQSNNYWVFNKSGTVQLVESDSSGMVANPNMAVSGLSDLMSISSIDNNSVATVDRNGNVKVYTYNTASGNLSLDPTESFATGLTNITSINAIPGTQNFVVTTNNGSFEYVYNNATGGYQKDSIMTVTSASQTIVSGAVADDGNMVSLLDPTEDTAYEFNEVTNSMQTASLYSVGSLSKAIAVSLPSDSSTVIADSNGVVNTYEFNPSINQMTKNSNLQITGLTFTPDYKSPGVYQSTPITTGQNNMFQLVPTENNDSGTSITYALSVDGGSTFTAVPPNAWTHLPAGTTNPPAGANVPAGPYIVQATLNSSSSNATPRITDMALNGYLDVTPPTAPGQPTASPNPSGQTTTTITWPASTDVLQAPSTGVSGVSDYLIQFSTDGGTTWGSWIDTNSATPDYVFTVPPNTAQNYTVRVEAKDAAGNISNPSPVGTIFIDTYPLGIVKTKDGGVLTVTNIINPSSGQTYPTDIVPVYVMDGGEVIYQIQTTGSAQEVDVTYSDGTMQSLTPQGPTTGQDTATWEGWYYPSGTSTIPLTTPQGTNIQITQILVKGLNKTPFVTSSNLLIINGSISLGSTMTPHLSS